MAARFLATVGCAHAATTTRIDASSEDTFKSSLLAMRQELGREKQAQLDGMTAGQIIDLAGKTVTVKIRVGPPPGLPDEFKAPLRPGTGASSSDAGTFALAGTRWVVTDNINGHVSEMTLKLLADGKVDDGGATAGRWERVGTKVRIALNDDYAVYLGDLDEPVAMHGAAANINGSAWTWVAKRSDLL